MFHHYHLPKKEYRSTGTLYWDGPGCLKVCKILVHRYKEDGTEVWKSLWKYALGPHARAVLLLSLLTVCTYIGSIYVCIYIYIWKFWNAVIHIICHRLSIYRLRPRLSFPVFCWDVPVVSLHPASVILSHFFTSVFLMLLLIFFIFPILISIFFTSYEFLSVFVILFFRSFFALWTYLSSYVKFWLQSGT